MNILNLSSVDYGGAGQVAQLYHDFFLSQGHKSVLIVKDSKGTQPVVVYERKNIHKINVLLFKLMHSKLQLTKDYHFYNLYETISTVSVTRLLKSCSFNPDIIFLYWVSDFINANTVHQLAEKTGARIYWLMIDNAPITGGCHYPWDCGGYLNNCTDCPAIQKRRFKIIASDNLAKKRKYLPEDLNLIVFSSTDYSRALKSALFKNRNITKISGYVNELKYKPGDKELMKKHWGIESAIKVVFFGAADIKDKRKGISWLVDAINGLDYDNLILLIAGKVDTGLFNKSIRQIGFLQEDDLIKAYQAADVFVCPSIEDSGPMMINQAIMCGTPVVAFSMGVAPDLVQTGKTGYLAKLCDSNDLANGIKSILSLNEADYLETSGNCRELGLMTCGSSVFTKNLEKLLFV